MDHDELRRWLLQRLDALPFRDTDVCCAAARIVRMGDASAIKMATDLVVALEGIITVELRGIQSCALGSA